MLEFFVLGIIPGTNIQLNFASLMLVVAGVLGVAEIALRWRFIRHQHQLNHLNQISL